MEGTRQNLFLKDDILIYFDNPIDSTEITSTKQIILKCCQIQAILGIINGISSFQQTSFSPNNSQNSILNREQKQQ